MENLNKYQPIPELEVGLQFQKEILRLGRLATRDYKIYFEYDSSFLQSGINISPLKLPFKSSLQVFDYHPFEGLAGVFNDSLPDGWGRLLFDRYMRSQNILPDSLSPLDRLAYVGASGLGALVYKPDYSQFDVQQSQINLDVLSQQIKDVLEGESGDVLNELINLNGSSAGARPKALIGLNQTRDRIISGKLHLDAEFEPWMVKFANSNDGIDAGAIEYVYALMAKEAGIEIMPVHLFEAANSAGYFATKRFDRQKGKRLHMHTASGLLHSNFRTPSLDYEDLIALTGYLTKDVREIEKMYRLAVFNVLSHNRDDHGKNFSFLMNKKGEWQLSPSYDLTFSSGPRGHQSTMVMGEGQNPSIEHLIKLGNEAGLKPNTIHEIIEQTRYALNQFTSLARNYGINKTNKKLIQNRIEKFKTLP